MRAVVLREGRLEVRDTPDPVPGPGELLVRTVSTAICASDVRFMDHHDRVPAGGPAGMVYDPERDIVLGHGFVGDVVAHGPGCSDALPVVTRVTAMPILLVDGGLGGTKVIGQHPEAPGSFGELLLVPEAMARAAGGWYTGDSLDCTTATHKGVTIQFGGGPHPEDWYGTLDAVCQGRLDPLPCVGRTIGLDGVPEALDLTRRGAGPPRIVVHPGA
jgi:threonine dehydrogenase-like Zn-dependent dehydrogenase